MAVRNRRTATTRHLLKNTPREEPHVVGLALTLRFDLQPDSEDALEKFLTQQALPQISQREDIAGVHLMVADKAASSVLPDSVVRSCTH